MPAPLAKQVLVAIGGDVAAKYGTLIWRKAPPAFGGETAYSFTRAGNGLYLANDVSVGGLVVRTASGGNARIEQLIDPVNGVLQNYLKLEAASSNWCLQSQALATTWVANLLTPTNNSAAAPDGTTTATKLVPTAVSSNIHQVSQTITITAGEFVAYSGFLQASGYTGVQLLFNGNLGGYLMVMLDLAAGTTTTQSSASTLSGSAVIPMANGVYWLSVWGKHTDGSTSTGATVRVFNTYANALATAAYTGDAVSGIYAWGMQLERNGTNVLPPTSYIATTTAKVDRNADAFNVPWFIAPRELATGWIYARWLEMGTNMFAGANHRILGVGPTGAFTPPELLISGDTANNRYLGMYNNGGANPQSEPAVVPTFLQAVEALLLVNNGAPILRISVNAAADVVGSTPSAVSLASSIGAALLQVGADPGGSNPGLLNVSRVLVGLGAVSSIADVRSIL